MSQSQIWDTPGDLQCHFLSTSTAGAPNSQHCLANLITADGFEQVMPQSPKRQCSSPT